MDTKSKPAVFVDRISLTCIPIDPSTGQPLCLNSTEHSGLIFLTCWADNGTFLKKQLTNLPGMYDGDFFLVPKEGTSELALEIKSLKYVKSLNIGEFVNPQTPQNEVVKRAGPRI